jgi:hypothetical protein
MPRVGRDGRRFIQSVFFILKNMKWRKVRAPRVKCQVTPGKCELTESATENKPPILQNIW